MKPNYIKYSREQQIILVVLACFILIAVSVDAYIRHNTEASDSFMPDSAVVAQMHDFENSLESIQSRPRSWASRSWNDGGSYASAGDTYIPRQRFPFDPNTVDSIDLLRLGFKPYMAHNLINYRRHGGKIYSIDKLKKIYGIDVALVDSLKSIISFASVRTVYARADTVQRPVYTPKEYFHFEINSADTALLQRLPNIGPGRAKMIIAYRSHLGGFHSIEQLYEISDMPREVIDPLAPYASFDLSKIRKIKVNKCSIKQLKRHPYINYYQARAIYDLRWDDEHMGRISLSDLDSIKEFTPEQITRLTPYIEF